MKDDDKYGRKNMCEGCIDPHHTVIAFFRHLKKICPYKWCHTSVVDQHIDPAKCLKGLLHQPFPVLPVIDRSRNIMPGDPCFL